MNNIPATSVRIDPEIKKQAAAVFEELGIGMSAGINAFLRAVVREGGMPFKLTCDPEGRNTKKAGNADLNHAFLARRDEFYTQIEDIEKEVCLYKEFFRDKTVLCNCDDPFESAFFKYFVLHFEELGLKKLICTCYAGSPFAGREYPIEGSNDAYKAEVTELPSASLLRPDSSLDLEALFELEGNTLERLRGDGDFRSEECIKLLEEADVVVTNPPFSLFREYLGQLIQYNKKFLIIGNMNASTCKDIFPLFKEDKLWYGVTMHSGDRKFLVPDDYPLKASSCGIDELGRRFIRVKGVRWFTNLENARHHENLELSREYNKQDYPRYENYDAIEVSKTSQIPVNYNGFMGVPITFLDKYSPDQFQIYMLANGNARTNVEPSVLKQVGYRQHSEDRGGVGIINGERCYARIIIRRREYAA